MSNQNNDRFIESLFARLEGLEAFMNLPEYADRQQQLLRAVSRNDLAEAEDQVLQLERDYSGIMSDIDTQDRLDLQAEYSDVF